MPSKSEKKPARGQTFRAGVGAVIADAAGRVLAFKRKGTKGAWQFPQGGLESGEEPFPAVLREIEEETGIESSHLEPVDAETPLLAYELPPEHRTTKSGRGQAQRWFLFRFVGPERAITLGDGKEFEAWRWATLREVADQAVAFRKPVYERLMEIWGPALTAPRRDR